VEQRLSAIINFRCNSAGMCSGSSKAKHVFTGTDAQRAKDKNELQQYYELQDANEPPFKFTRRICNRHSGICPVMLHMPGQTFAGPQSIYHSVVRHAVLPTIIGRVQWTLSGEVTSDGLPPWLDTIPSSSLGASERTQLLATDSRFLSRQNTRPRSVLAAPLHLSNTQAESSPAQRSRLMAVEAAVVNLTSRTAAVERDSATIRKMLGNLLRKEGNSFGQR
jgi:hypothetical protein